MIDIKKLFIAALSLLTVVSATAYAADYSWAEEAVEYCVEKKILSGMDDGSLALGDTLTKEQMAKLLADAYSLEYEIEEVTEETEDVTTEADDAFLDVSEDDWSYKYIMALKPYLIKDGDVFSPKTEVTREEFIATLVRASGLTKSNIRNKTIIESNFDDYDDIDEDYYPYMTIAVERGYIKGYDGMLRPTDKLTRAEVCTVLYRIIEGEAGNIKLDLGVRPSETPLLGEAQITYEDAANWAKSKGAAELFINAAEIYWKYGELTGIRPEVLYAQAAKETGFGKYGGSVAADSNNFAGIKTATATGDAQYDHEVFETQDDGVRAHFNHVCAYLGIEPIGEPHERYYVVKRIRGGSVHILEDMGGNWCPDLYYGYSIRYGLLDPMIESARQMKG